MSGDGVVRVSHEHFYDGKQQLWVVTETVTTVVGSFTTYPEARAEWERLLDSDDRTAAPTRFDDAGSEQSR